ncbi:MAG TPA: hypothetical protein VK797_15945 [Tepidisphaeraceae bacterium]|jgi:hypothetical protein|nr:hypothetical protein [Tepidisphaeraceae bacterium]
MNSNVPCDHLAGGAHRIAGDSAWELSRVKPAARIAASKLRRFSVTFRIDQTAGTLVDFGVDVPKRSFRRLNSPSPDFGISGCHDGIVGETRHRLVQEFNEFPA